MLRLILNFIVIYLIVRFARSLMRGRDGVLGRFFGRNEKKGGPRVDGQSAEPKPYSEITPYDIEDAEYEDINS